MADPNWERYGAGTGLGAAVLLAVQQFFAPLARFVSYAVAGVPPEIMGIGPIKAIPKVLAQAALVRAGDVSPLEPPDLPAQRADRGSRKGDAEKPQGRAIPRATHNARVVGGVMVVEGEQVVVGDTASSATNALVEYEVLCRRHFMRRMNSAAARAAATSPDTLPFDLDVCPVPQG